MGGGSDEEDDDMPTYTAPLDDIRFVLFDLLEGGQRWRSCRALPMRRRTWSRRCWRKPAKFAADELQPINHSGDEEGCRYENGTVTTPKGFKEAYAKFVEGGWPGLPCDPEYGGQGLPKALNFAVEEMIGSANLSFGMYPGLSNGAYNALKLHGTPEQKATYLPKLVSGTWSGTMCLTEPQCGTDLGLIKTKAEPRCRRQLQDHRHQDLHLRRRARPDRQHHAPGAGAPARCAGRHQGHLAVRVPKFLPNAHGRAGPAQRARAAARSSTRWASRPRPPA